MLVLVAAVEKMLMTLLIITLVLEIVYWDTFNDDRSNGHDGDDDDRSCDISGRSGSVDYVDDKEGSDDDGGWDDVDDNNADDKDGNGGGSDSRVGYGDDDDDDNDDYDVNHNGGFSGYS